MAQVTLEKVTKVYPGGVKAVNDVSLKIADQEFVVLVGPSGCGKSTTLRMVAGLEEITCGTIRVGEQIVNNVPPRDRDVAMVFQDYALYPHLSVYQNMAFGLKLRGTPRAEIDHKVREGARLLGIEDLLNRPPRALSGGQRQRVALGRAIVRTPRAFLFDEPLSHLDARLRVEMRAELKRLHRRVATTTLYVTHDQEEAMTLGDRVVVMKDGIVQQVASPPTLYEQPANRFVAGFVGSPPMNFLNGKIRGENGHLYFCEESARLRLPERLHRCLAGREGTTIVLGIRPEGLSDQAEGGFAGPENALAATVQVTEFLGDRMDVLARTSDNEQIVCRVDARKAFTEGRRVSLYVNMDRVHLFEPGDQGVNVSLTNVGERASAA